MNILIPHHWLLEHLETEADPEKIRESVSLCGPSVERIETIENEPVYDIEVTTNRVDSMSVRGIAREAATILPEFNVDATLKPLSFNREGIVTQFQDQDDLPISIKNNPKLCHRILAVTMSVDTVGPSPEWLQKRLTQVGQRPLNNLIDITNYVMWELGHPIHVFDLDKLTEKKIIVRQAVQGETFVTLDEKKHTTKGGEVVFDDGAGNIIDLPGIMGTANSVVSDSTKNILVWIESVPAKLIRLASMGLAIRTQAAVLNEKNVDPNLGEDAILRAIDLYIQLANGHITSRLYDDYPVKPTINSSELRHDQVKTYLGIEIESEKIVRILTDLGCLVRTDESIDSLTYHITPPSFRAHDLVIPQDYIEEIARIYGYHNLPSQLMPTAIPDVTTNLHHSFEHTLKQRLADWGLHEVYTYSLISKKMAEDSGIKLNDHIRLTNPLNEDLVYLRRSIIPSHNEVFTTNKAHKQLSIFELANVYLPPTDNTPALPTESLQLVISSTSEYRTLKGILESLLSILRVEKVSITPVTDKTMYGFNPSSLAEIKSGEVVLGYIGETTYGFYSIQLEFSELLALSQPHPTYIPIPQTAPIIEDMTFTLPDKTPVGPVISLIKEQSEQIDDVQLKDIYNQNYTFSIIYWDKVNQLESEKLEPIRKAIRETLQSNFKATLVGKF